MIYVLNHPLINSKLTIMRDKLTKDDIFAKKLKEISQLMLYEITKKLAVSTKEVITPNEVGFKGCKIKDEIVLVPILRAGLGMYEGMKDLFPTAKCGHIGLVRDESTLEAKKYFYKMPCVPKNSQIIVLDPMLATGGSAAYAIECLQKDGFINISLACILGVDEGIEKVLKSCAKIDIFLAAKDEGLNEAGYIMPGLGDAGDRVFGTQKN